MFILCKTAEIPKAHSTSETLKNEGGNNNVVQESNQFKFYQRNNNSPSEHIPPHTNTKWSMWTPVPNGNMLNLPMQRENAATSSMVNGTNIIITGNNDVRNSTNMELTVSNTTFNHTLFNKANQTDPGTRNSNNQSYVVTPSSETINNVSNTYRNTRNRISYSKGITYYLWDTVYLILKCFKDHWKSGVVDCVTSRASTLLDGLLGIGSTRRHQLLSKEGFELIPYDEILEESPRNDEGLAIGEDEDDEEEEMYDEGNKDSGEGELV
jgi:hypothetical protein